MKKVIFAIAIAIGIISCSQFIVHHQQADQWPPYGPTTSIASEQWPPYSPTISN